MNPVALSVAVYGSYLLVNGMSLLLIPGLAEGLLGLPSADGPWPRLFGLMVGEIGAYFLFAARRGLSDFFRATVFGRAGAALVFAALVASGTAPAALLLLAAVDLASALWTWMASRQRIAPSPGDSTEI